MKTKYIGVSGVARVGKNLFCDIASDILYKERGLSSKTYSLANCLKKDCEVFLRDKLGLNVWSEDTLEKSIFRPLLIWYGGVKRNASKGRCWIEMLDPDVRKSTADICFISDVRFCKYANDEAYWVQTELGGKLVHISKFSYLSSEKVYTQPASQDETVNDPMLKHIADASMEWMDSGEHTYESARKCPILIEQVRTVINTLV
jgi:hypothetical protein